MGGNVNEFKRHCRSKVINDFINKWYNELNVDHKPLLRTYCLFKFDFGTESYLYNVKDVRYRSAISKLRVSSHILEIERGRYTNRRYRLTFDCVNYAMLSKMRNILSLNVLLTRANDYIYSKEYVAFILMLTHFLDKRQLLILLMGSTDARIQKWFGKFLYQSFIIRNHSHEILVGSNLWLLIDECWFAIYNVLASIYSMGMCATSSCWARLTRSNFTMLWNQLLTILAWLWFYCRMHFNCIYTTEVLQLIRFNVVMPLSNPTMNNICNIPLVFICVHNTILCFLSYHVPMFSLLMYFVRNDKNKDDQSIYLAA